MNNYRRLRIRILVSLVLTVLAVVVRLPGVFSLPPQPDERHWTSRSAMFINRANRGEWRDVTTHLPHPGLPESVAMGISQELFQRFDNHFGLTIADPSYVTRLEASRLASVAISSLIPALVFIGFECLIGFWPALLGAILILLDPIHIGVSRWSHLDAPLGLFVLSSSLLYLKSLQTENIKLKLTAGIMWGLALASKPTAIALIPAFLMFRLVYYYWLKKRALFSSIVSWSDLATVVVGHITFAAIYTRFWNHPSDYPIRLGVKSKLAGELYQLGIKLNQDLVAWFWIILLIALGASLTFMAKKKKLSAFSWQVGLGAILVGFVLATLATFPAVYENYAMYWTWVLGLSEIQHKHFNQGMIEVRPGYFSLLFTRTPLVFLIGLVVGTGSCVHIMIAKRKEDMAPLCLCLVVSLIWLLLLNTSGKQTWRYALPVMPLLVMLSAVGWLTLSSYLTKFTSKIAAEQLITWAVALCLGVTSLPWMHYHEFFFNSLGLGLRASIDSGHILPIRGHKEAIEYLLSQAPKFENRPRITVLGDARTVEYTTELYFSKDSTRLRFGDFQPWHSDYLMLFTTAGVAADPKLWAKTLLTDPVFVFSWKGIDFLKLYRVLPYSLSEPLVLRTSDFHLPNAELKPVGQSPERWLTMRPGHQSPGFSYFFDGLRLEPGTYKITTQFKIIPGPNKADVRDLGYLELGSTCQKSVPLPRSATGLIELSFVCQIGSNADIFPRFYWNGALGLAAGPIRIEPQE